MKGLLKEKSEIEKLKREYQIFSEVILNVERTIIKSIQTQEELISEDCEL